MKQADKPLWQQLFQPSCREELLELKETLHQYPSIRQQLEAFLCAEVHVMHAKARVELNPELRAEYLTAAHALTELLGKLFAPTSSATTASPLI